MMKHKPENGATQAVRVQSAHGGLSVAVISDRSELETRYAEYVSDESNLPGELPQEIAFPKRWEEVSSYLHDSLGRIPAVIVAGAQTGLTGGAVAQADAALLSLSKLRHIETVFSNEELIPRVRCGAGVSLADLQEYVAENLSDFWFPVDPTERTASLGGLAAVGAAGARSYRYGSCREWITWLRAVLADGSVVELERNGPCLDGSVLRLQGEGGERCLELEETAPIPNTKRSLGYLVRPSMDVIDLFIGSEGTLGVITDVELRLEPKPKHFLYVLQFFENEQASMDFVDALEGTAELFPLAIESCDAAALRLIESSPQRAQSRSIQHIRPEHQAAVFVEFSTATEDELESVLERFLLLLEEHAASAEDCIAGSEERDIRDMKLFRHAVPERINALIRSRRVECPALHKVALDMAVPRGARGTIFRLYKSCFEAAGLEFSIFGHAGDAHFHVNLMPKNEQELMRAKELYAELARQVVAMGGAVAAEHGIGRMKKHLVGAQFNESVLRSYRALRAFFDPAGRLAPGVLFDAVGQQLVVGGNET